jgi:hypothetical protein
MCVPMIGAAISAIGSIASGMAEASMAKYNEKVSKINANAAYVEGIYRGGLARTEGESVKSSQIAAMGASGADITSGSFDEMQALQTFRTEQTSGLEIWKGQTEQTKYLNEAKLYKQQAKAAKISGFIGGASSLVGGLQASIGAGGLGSATYSSGPPRSVLA